MEPFEFAGPEPFDCDLIHKCSDPDLTQSLALNYIAQGVDPLQAALDAQLYVPLIKPFL